MEFVHRREKRVYFGIRNLIGRQLLRQDFRGVELPHRVLKSSEGLRRGRLVDVVGDYYFILMVSARGVLALAILLLELPVLLLLAERRLTLTLLILCKITLDTRKLSLFLL